MNQFQPGQHVVLREVLSGRIWAARPEIVVQDTRDLLVLYIPPDAIWKQPVALDGTRVNAENRLRLDWLIKDMESHDSSMLRMTIPDSNYSVIIFANASDGSIRQWYINLEDPLCRIKSGFEYVDQWLDITAAPDLTSWQWKDEDEFEEAVHLGIVSPRKAKLLRNEGEKAIKWLQSGTSPFNDWANWRPDPSWAVPVLLDGWDKV